jgi:hypothetical protein
MVTLNPVSPGLLPVQANSSAPKSSLEAMAMVKAHLSPHLDFDFPSLWPHLACLFPPSSS